MSLINLFTNVPVPPIFLGREYDHTLTLTPEDLPFYLHASTSSTSSTVPGWSKLSIHEIYPDPMKMYEYRFLELFGFAIKQNNSYYIHTSAEEQFYNPETGLFNHPERLRDFAPYVHTVLEAYSALNTHSLRRFPDSKALQHMDMDIKDYLTMM
jgi:hypothetical protein